MDLQLFPLMLQTGLFNFILKEYMMNLIAILQNSILIAVVSDLVLKATQNTGLFVILGGKAWGEAGYIRMLKDHNDQCAIATLAFCMYC